MIRRPPRSTLFPHTTPSRSPRKPLLPLGGEPLIIVVTRRIADFGVCDRIVVATDAREIANVVADAGFEAVMTSSHHTTGTERGAEVVAKAPFSGFNFILNVPGDEPLLAAGPLPGAPGQNRRANPSNPIPLPTP